MSTDSSAALLSTFAFSKSHCGGTFSNVDGGRQGRSLLQSPSLWEKSPGDCLWWRVAWSGMILLALALTLSAVEWTSVRLWGVVPPLSCSTDQESAFQRLPVIRQWAEMTAVARMSSWVVLQLEGSLHLLSQVESAHLRLQHWTCWFALRRSCETSPALDEFPFYVNGERIRLV